MSVTAEIYQAVRGEIKSLMSPYTKLGNGPVPMDSGITTYLGPNTPETLDLCRGGQFTYIVALNAKNEDLQTVMDVLGHIHESLTMGVVRIRGTGWEIFSIETEGGPTYLDKEDSTKQWLFGSTLAVKVNVHL